MIDEMNEKRRIDKPKEIKISNIGNKEEWIKRSLKSGPKSLR